MSESDRVATRIRVHIPLLKTGISNLDVVLGGGLPELSFTILAGSPGVGKTTLAHQMLFAIAEPERPGLYFSVLGEPIIKLLRYQQQFTFFQPERVGRDVIYIDLADELRTGGASHAFDVITSAVSKYAPSLVVIDSFRALIELAQQEWEVDSTRAGRPVRHTRDLIHDLALLMTSWETTTLVVEERDTFDVNDAPEYTVADGILWLSQETRLNDVTRKLQALKLRGAAPLPGRHAFRIDATGLQVFPRLSPIVYDALPKPAGRSSFGVTELDQMMHGGIPSGQACLIAGNSGTGKTLLALHFLMAGAQAGEPGVLVTFEERPQEHIRKAANFGWDLPALEQQGLLGVLALRPVDLSVDEVLGQIQDMVTRLNARRVVINSVSGFELAVTPSEQVEFHEALYRLVANLTNAGITVVLTTEVRDLIGNTHISTYGVSFITDNLLLLRYAEIDSALRKVLMVVKMRTSDHDKELREFRITDQGVSVEAPFTEYSGVLSGMPTQRIATGPQPYTSGLVTREASLTATLASAREASAAQLAAQLALPEADVQEMLDKLVDTGYVVMTMRSMTPIYRAALLTPGGPASRSPRHTPPDERTPRRKTPKAGEEAR